MCIGAVPFVHHRSQKVLVLCCDRDVRDVVSSWTRASGFLVDIATSGGRAAKLLQRHDYRALVMDRFVPPWPGLGGIPRVKRRYPDVRIVVLLKPGPVGAASLLRIAGADAVVGPPLRQAALLGAILPDGSHDNLGVVT